MTVFRQATVVLGLLLSLLQLGCAIVLVRSSKHEMTPGPYPATRYDGRFIANGFTSDTRNGWTGDRMRTRDRVAILFLGLIDMPFSLVTDTLCLPSDLITDDVPKAAPAESCQQD